MYRAGTEYFYIITVTYGTFMMNRRATATPFQNLTAHDFYSWCLRETLAHAGYGHLTGEDVAVTFYHAEPN